MAALWRIRFPGARVLRWSLKACPSTPQLVSEKAPQRLCQPVVISPPLGRRHSSSSGPPELPADKPASATEAAIRGLRILRERSDDLQQDDAMEAWRYLLHAACADSVPADVYFALGNLHYIWGGLLESGKRAELGAEGAARAVVAEIRELRKQAIKKRQLAPASGGGTRRRKASTGGQAKTSGSSDGTSPGIDHPDAWEWYAKAADKGDTRAMMQLGDIAMESAKKSSIHASCAEEWYRKSAEGDPPQPDALFQVARIWHEGIGVTPDPALAQQLYEEAYDAGSSAAAFFLGHRLHIGDDELGIEADGGRALKLMRRASEQGHAEATFYLAQAYRSGCPEMGLSQDLRNFAEMLQQAAAAGSEDALFALGAAFFHGEDGFARDPRSAFRCYSAAAELGHAEASYCLGVMHYTMGSFEEAFRCYQTAAEGGNMFAWRSLASMYALGEGVPQSEQMAKTILATFGDKLERPEEESDGEEGKPGNTPSAA